MAMFSKAKLKVVEPAPPALSPERVVLAAAITTAAEAILAAEKTRAAVRVAEGMVREAEACVSTAQADLDAARAARVSSIVSATTSGVAVTSDTSMRDIRLREAEAVDDLAAAHAALATIREPLAELEGAITSAERARERAALNVVLGTLPAITSDAKRLLDGLVERVAPIRTILAFNKDSATEREHEARRLLNAIGRFDERVFEPSPEQAAPWLAALEALKSDPDAQLPAV